MASPISSAYCTDIHPLDAQARQKQIEISEERSKSLGRSFVLEPMIVGQLPDKD
jgi:hypothetical protein